MEQFKKIYTFKNCNNELFALGPENKNINLLSTIMGIDIVARHQDILIPQKNDETMLVQILTILENLSCKQIYLSNKDIKTIANSIYDGSRNEIIAFFEEREVFINTNSGKSIIPRSLNQYKYLKSLEKNDIVFGIGTAGTGKTFLAIMFAAKLYKSKKIKKIFLVRPIVEAGEKLGFLPGDMKEKIDPFLVPLYDALYEVFGKEETVKMIAKGIIEVAPLAYMRGRTLEDAIIILDEAQNSTNLQMKMFLTRLGINSKMVITGDTTQIDLPRKNNSGLVEAVKILRDIKGIDIVEFNKNDVMRHDLVSKIIERYEELETKEIVND